MGNKQPTQPNYTYGFNRLYIPGLKTVRRPRPLTALQKDTCKIIESHGIFLVFAYIHQTYSKLPTDIINMIITFYNQNTVKCTIPTSSRMSIERSYPVVLFDTDLQTTINMKLDIESSIGTLIITRTEPFKSPNDILTDSEFLGADTKLYAHIKCEQLYYQSYTKGEKLHYDIIKIHPYKKEVNYIYASEKVVPISCPFLLPPDRCLITFEIYCSMLPSKEMRKNMREYKKRLPRKTFLWNVDENMLNLMWSTHQWIKSPKFYNGACFCLNMRNDWCYEYALRLKLCILCNPLGFDEKLIGGIVKIMDNNSMIYVCEMNGGNLVVTIPSNSGIDIEHIKSIQFNMNMFK
eukprot:143782_1